MPLYYGRLFPFAPVARWLAHGNDGKHAQADRSFLKRREFCFTLPGDIFVRCVRGRPGLPAPEPPRSALIDLASTECAVCLDGDAEYAAVPCGHRCLCANCSQTVSECPVCRAAMTAVLRVFV